MRNNKWYILHLFILLLCSLVLVPGNTAVADTGTGEVENLPVQSDHVLPDGEYVIAVAAETGYYLDIRGSGVASDHNVVQLIGPVAANKVPDDDIWMIEYDNSDQYYTIKQKGSNMCLNVPNASKEEGVTLEVLTCADTPEQKWAITMNADSSYRLTNKNSGFCMDNPEGTIIAEKQIAQYFPNETVAQKWMFFEREKPVVSNCVVSDVTSAGYTVTCDVSDNVDVVKTRYPTWPINTENPNDHKYLIIPWPEGTPTEGKASYQVNVNGNNGRTYMTHIYAHDAVGNEGIAGVSVYVPISDSGERLELKGSLDHEELDSLVKDGVTFATADIYLNGASEPDFRNQTEFNQTIPAGTTYRIVVTPAKGFSLAEGSPREFNGLISENEIISVRPAIVTVLPTGIVLEPSNASIKVGETISIVVSFIPDETWVGDVQWIPDDTGFVAVGENGIITGLAEGTATITVTSETYPNLTATCVITVTPAEVTPVLPTSITLVPESASVMVGDDVTIAATVSPGDAEDKSVKWESSDPSIATVDENGKVTGVAEGSAKITVTSNADPTVTAVCEITVTPGEISPVLPTSLVFDQKTGNVAVGEKLTLSAAILPDNADDLGIIWSSSDPSIATVEEGDGKAVVMGTVTGVAEGTVTITAKSSAVDSLFDTCVITVTAGQPPAPVLPTSITLNPFEPVSVESGNTLRLTATVLPENADDKTITWESSDPTVATVDENGNVTGVAEGTATITVASNADPSVTTQIQVTVTAPIGPQPQPRPHRGINFWRFDIVGQPLPRTGFSAVRPQALPEMPLDLNYQPLRWTLEIPSLSVAADLVKVPNVEGEYPITWLGDKVGLLEGFAMPGEGYTVLTGHNHLNTTEAGPFALLSSVKEGDRIFVRDANDGMKIFVVYANEKVSETDYDAVESIAVKYDGSLTMVTCEDERIEGGYANRRIVAARPF